MPATNAEANELPAIGLTVLVERGVDQLPGR